MKTLNHLAKGICMIIAAVFLQEKVCSQKIFFKSQQTFTATDLNSFYSSVAINDSVVFFNANDFNLYAYDKRNGHLKWVCNTNYKTNQAIFFAGDKLIAGIYENRVEMAALVDAASGEIIKQLPFGPLATRPILRNRVLFTTAIYDAGCLVAYDMNTDSVLWSRFLAHGFSRQPYYFNETLVANAESDNWVELNYKGQLMDSTCPKKAEIFVSDIPCVKNYITLSHDRREIKGKLAEKIFGKNFYGEPEVITSRENTFILQDDVLYILGDKLKLKHSIKILDTDTTGEDISSPVFIEADAHKVSFQHGNRFSVYDLKQKQFSQVLDLGEWAPHRILPDKDKLWLISRKDGLLYGLSIETNF